MIEVKLANGKTVSWDEFSRWSFQKQRGCICPDNLGKLRAKSVIEKIKSTKQKNREIGDQGNLSKGGSHGRARCVLTPGGEFPTVKEAAQHYGIDGGVLINWIKRGVKGFAYKNKLEYNIRPKGTSKVNKRSISVITPEGVFASKRQVMNHFKLKRSELDLKLKTPKKSGFKINNNPKKVDKNIKFAIRTPDGEFTTLREAADFYGLSINGIKYRLESVHLPKYKYID